MSNAKTPRQLLCKLISGKNFCISLILTIEYHCDSVIGLFRLFHNGDNRGDNRVG